jgi:hypothetical protein
MSFYGGYFVVYVTSYKDNWLTDLCQKKRQMISKIYRLNVLTHFGANEDQMWFVC